MYSNIILMQRLPQHYSLPLPRVTCSFNSDTSHRPLTTSSPPRPLALSQQARHCGRSQCRRGSDDSPLLRWSPLPPHSPHPSPPPRSVFSVRGGESVAVKIERREALRPSTDALPPSATPSAPPSATPVAPEPLCKRASASCSLRTLATALSSPIARCMPSLEPATAKMTAAAPGAIHRIPRRRCTHRMYSEVRSAPYVEKAPRKAEAKAVLAVFLRQKTARARLLFASSTVGLSEHPSARPRIAMTGGGG